ncbi:Phosphatidylserine decarboxylase proenzyme [Rickettsiales endosymbiont of Trichoplax sp. H2]|nr:Phosphatidylserine decarboxylase proenzyme [Rickettsiales endosymbiont of Trichoplax sp. H2]
MLDSIKEFIPSIHKEGYFFISVFAIITLILFMWSQQLGWIGFILTLWCIFFFRDPNRVIPNQNNVLVSPADGIIQKIEKAKMPKEISSNDKEMNKISIFLNVFDVHVNRIPISAKVKKLSYHHGKFFNASLDKASEHNERQSILLELNDKQEVGVIQIAGLIARRIVCDLKEDQKVSTGERLGIIRFGSRVDVYLPNHFEIKVLEGQRMIGGESVIAELRESKKSKSVSSKSASTKSITISTDKKNINKSTKSNASKVKVSKNKVNTKVSDKK